MILKKVNMIGIVPNLPRWQREMVDVFVGGWFMVKPFRAFLRTGTIGDGLVVEIEGENFVTKGAVLEPYQGEIIRHVALLD